MWAEETKTVVGSAVVEAQQAPPAPEPEAPGMAAWPAGCCDKSTFTTAAVGNAHDAAVDWMSSRRTSICSAVSARLASWKTGHPWNCQRVPEHRPHSEPPFADGAVSVCT